ncbi:MAG: class I SAM-dependent methyltransferase [Anaerolineaceae bacterium]|nr:class I SAM-dependent methyltransferase [Anaerolineaceae bacterium]
MNGTLDYYNLNAEDYAKQTLTVDFSDTQDRFLKKLPAGALILDFGCGAGRDTKYFLEHGYIVTAVDGSPELCEIASKHTGIPVRQMFFQDLNDAEAYDGIWACASVLHLPIDILNDVFSRMSTAVRTNGILYVSFKYGCFEGQRNGRWFTDFTEEKFLTFLQRFSELAIEKMWTSNDVRPGRENEKWLNIILRKTVFR